MSKAMRTRSICVGIALALAGGSVFASEPDPNRVFVKFKAGSKANVERSLQGAGARFHHSFDELNTFAVSVPPQAMAGLRNNPNIELIEQDAPRYPMAQTTPYGISMVQAQQAWAMNATGAGIKVCIIDSGIKANHEDLAGLNITGGYPVGYNNDTCGHGSHVAGTIGAVDNASGVVGVSPGHVSLHIVKVFDGSSCGWSYSSTLVDAANRCATAGAKVINMSLGGGTSSTTENTAFQNHYNNGILSIAAAGNGGNNRHSYPASYSSVVSVAAVDSNKARASFSQYTNQVELSAPGVAVLSTVPGVAASASVAGASYMVSALDGSVSSTVNGALASASRCTSSSPGSLTGKIVLCERGDIAFNDKARNVQASGGIGVIIYNNEPGSFAGTLGTSNVATIPAVSLSREDGVFLLGNRIGSSATVSTVANPNGSGYEAWDGTSMATPHVAGAAAVIWSKNPSWTNVQIRQALQATAEDLGAAGRDNYYGYGLIRTADAIAYLQGSGGGGDPPPPPPPPPPGNATVQSVSIAFSVQGPNRTALGTAVVSAAGASVTGCFSGAISGCGTGTANSSGSITFSSAKYKSTAAVTFCVTGLNGQTFTTQHCATGSP